MSFVPRVHQNGGPCCTDERVLCDTCKMHFARTNLRMNAGSLSEFAPPDAYASLQPTKDPEMVARLAACAEEHAHFDAWRAAQPAPPRLTAAELAAELATFAPPDAYASIRPKGQR